MAEREAREKKYDENNHARDLLNSDTRVARKQRDKLERLADAHDAKLADQRRREKLAAHPLIRNAKENAEAAFRQAQRNPNAHPAEVQRRKQLLDFVLSADGDAEEVNSEYWRRESEATAAEYARLDAAAVEKQQTAEQANADAQAARSEADNANTDTE